MTVWLSFTMIAAVDPAPGVPVWVWFVGVTLAIPLLIIAGIFLVMPLTRFAGRLVTFVATEFSELFRLIGTILTGVVFVFLTLGNAVIGRWPAAQHFGRALRAEIGAAVLCVYRIGIGHPLRLFGMQGLVEGLEARVPAALMGAPARPASAHDRAHPFAARPDPGVSPSPRAAETAEAELDARGQPLPSGYRHPGAARSSAAGRFEGYEIIGTLPGGGSGSRLYVARPSAIKLAGFIRDGHHDVGDVVIKCFSISDGSSLPQIVRESRALEAARKLGLVLEHELTSERFLYVMRYVPGDSLGLVTDRLHAASGRDGLSNAGLRRVIGYAVDLVATLQQYHANGLWHKDIKPDNIIVSTHDGRAHLVDFGLLTPLRSGMTLTTHGTEYFRDPEMVRMALRGVKVADVDGGKFDIYGAGAVLYAMIENSFPAHGAMSQISRRCPEALRWIVRRAMTDYQRRYASSSEMLADLRFVQNAEDPFLIKPGQLPSVVARPAEFTPQSAAFASTPSEGPRDARDAMPSRLPRSRTDARSAAEILASARQRVEARRARVSRRVVAGIHGPRMRRGVDAGVVVAFGLLGAVVLGLLVLSSSLRTVVTSTARSLSESRTPRVSLPPPGTTAELDTPQPDSVRVVSSDTQRGRSGTSARTTRSGSVAPAPAADGGSQRGSRTDPMAIPAVAERVEALSVLLVVEAGARRPPLSGLVDARRAALADRGFAFPQDREAAELLEPALRAAVGARPIDTAEARSAVRAWIESRPAGRPRVDVVVWLTAASKSRAEDPDRLLSVVAVNPSVSERDRRILLEAFPEIRLNGAEADLGVVSP
jgi:serine/threonine protein kinase